MAGSLMNDRTSPDLNGYVLAGGKSSRMGQHKALLDLAGKPLALRAVQKLQCVSTEVCILGNLQELERYAPLVRDLHEGCGPLGGMEAAFVHSSKDRSSADWNLFMAVDMPFLPMGLLEGWVRTVIGQKDARLAMFVVDGRPQPALCLLHRDVAPYVSDAVGRGEFKLLRVLEAAAKDLAWQQQTGLEAVFPNFVLEEGVFLSRGGSWIGWKPTEKQWAIRPLWFANLNTPEDFAAAQALEGSLE
jgi:molybdopterin-guanine dinucleotide biosynthesis protein A